MELVRQTKVNKIIPLPPFPVVYQLIVFTHADDAEVSTLVAVLLTIATEQAHTAARELTQKRL